ncbi:NADH/Ubiquinone/plastoquinone (complex I) [Solidesulfovibrio fructosivorans JJ]]|uniref:NADH/Ubiquinone/plastoquinone (Complex I) n=1 Tax=Solidesulfovibrio fructosivorans JJ] TaxID=596151 RepID=E1JX76_SOLFR|nr:proton-conducting transporter membrane subunit [Solidesulfovibrio fructosivorans]EFL51041.1 NADH/Ubiquinone/plastoquinone (complex I) [Solidesulfovibrio fructosivorans JJ]]
MEWLLVAVALYIASGLLALALRQRAHAVGAAGAVLGCLAALAAVLSGPFNSFLAMRLSWGLPMGAFSLGLDPVSRLFLLPVCALGAICAVSGAAALSGEHGGASRSGAHWFFYNLLLAGLVLVMTARDAVCFLLAWEIMSLAPFFLIAHHDEEPAVREASWIYLVAAHLGAVCVIAFFTLLWAATGATGFAAIRLSLSHGGLAAPAVLFVLALVGFGAKAGFVPFHVWLPEAHPAAPSHVSAVLSGAMINAGLYGLWRALELIGPGASWQGWVLVALGLATALAGILQALAQGNLKRLLAYSSVENMGIILLGLGIGRVGEQAGAPAVAVLGLAGALLHMLNHAAFKGTLFLCAGEVLHGVGSVRLSHLGGLGKRMPFVGAAFALAAAGIAGLPPLAGFAGELTLAMAMFHGLDLPGLLPRAGFSAAMAALAAVGGFALAALAKADGLTFLGEPRTPAAATAHAPGARALVPVIALAACCVGAAVTAPWLFHLAAQAALTFPGLEPGPARKAAADALGMQWGVLAVLGGFAVLVLAILLVRNRLLAAAGTRREPTWGCGYLAPTARIQYGAASFVEPAARILSGPMGQKSRLDMAPGWFPARARLTVAAPDRLKTTVFSPAFEWTARICDSLKVVQHGRVHLYILYILATVVLLLAWKL